MADSYVWFGAGVAPSYLLIGIPLGHALKDLGIWGRLVAGLTILGAIATGISYPAKRFDEPWNTLWGIEGPVWLAVIAAGLVAWLHYVVSALSGRGWSRRYRSSSSSARSCWAAITRMRRSSGTEYSLRS